MLYYTILYYTILYYTILCYTVLYYTFPVQWTLGTWTGCSKTGQGPAAFVIATITTISMKLIITTSYYYY